MKRTIINSVIAAMAGGVLAGCGGSSSDVGTQPKMLATTAACYTAWSSSAVYTAGNTASYSGVNYTANFWTQNQNPSTNNGGAGSGQPWTSNGTCGGPTLTPTPTPTPTGSCTPYVAGTYYAAGNEQFIQ
jgi:chitinase